MSLDLATIGIAMDTSGLDKGTRSLKDAEKAADRTADAADRTGNSLRGISSYADLASKALASIGLGAAVTQFMRVADSVTQLNNALKLSTGSAKQAEQAYSALYEIAQRSRVSFIELGQTFTSLNRAGQEMGVSQQRMLAVTEAVGNAMAISGGSAQSMQAALVQLGQGMSSGVLRGEELNSVMEQAPRLAKALADGLGVPIGKLREMGAAGQITAEQVVRALESQSAVLSKEVAGATLTVGQAFTKLTNASTNAVGELDKASGASTSLANAVSSIATAMDGMGTAFKNNEAIIKTVMGALAGAAALATLAAIPRAIGAIGVAVTGLSAVLAANPIVLTVLGVGAVVGGGVAAVNAYKKTGDGIKASIQALEAENARAEKSLAFTAGMGSSYQRGDDATRVKIEERTQAIKALNAELALMSSAGLDTSAEDTRLARHTANAKAAKADADAVAKLTQELSGIPTGYTERMAEIIRLNQKGALVGKDYTDALAAMQAQMLKKTGVTKGAASAAREATSAYDKLASKLGADLTRAAAEAQAAQHGYNKAQTEFLALAASPEWAGYTAAQRASAAALYEQKIAAEQAADAAADLSRAQQEAAADRMQHARGMEQTVEGLLQSNQALRDEIEMLGLTEEQQTRVLQLRNEAIILTKEATLAELERQSAVTGTQTRVEIALAAEIAALKERNELLGAKGVKNTAVEAAKKAEDEWKKTTDQINESLTDALMRGFESGKDFAKNLRDTVVNMFKTMVLRPVVSAIVSPISQGITGMMGLSGAAQAGQGGNAASTAMSAASMFGAGGLGGSLAAGAGWLTGATTLGGSLSAGASLLGTGTLAGATSGLGMIAGALGPIALGIGAVVSLVKKLDDSGTPHTGGIGAYSADSGATAGAAVGLAFGIDKKHYTQAGEDLSTSVAKSIVQMLDITASTFGQKAGYYAATAFADDSSKDGAWGALRIKFGEKVLLDWADTAVRDANVPREFANGAAGKEQYLAAVAADVRVALNSIGLPTWATGMLDKLGQGATIEQLAGAVDQINAAKAAFAGFGQYMPTFAGLADSALGKLVDASGGAGALAGNMGAFVDGFYRDSEKLAINTQNVTDALAKLGFEMPKTREEFKTLVASQLAIAGLQLGSSGEMIRVSQAMNESAATSAAGLLALSGAVSAVLPVTDSVTESVKAMTKSLDDYISKTARSSTEADRIRGLAAVGNTAALKRLGVPGYASGGYHSGGLRLVGENGPELEVTGPANLISNPVTEQLLRGSGSANTARLEALVEKLTAEVANLRAETRAVVTHTATTARIIKRVTPDGDAIATREAAPV